MDLLEIPSIARIGSGGEAASPFFSIDRKCDGGERILGSAAELIGWTPLVETKRISAKEGALARIVVKLEGYQPGCSVKDRMALSMIIDAENKGLLIPGVSTIVEPTSGNTGIALALVAAVRGYKVVAVMPSSYSIERRMILKAFGAQVILTDPALGFAFLFDKARELAKTLPNACMLDQAQNPCNPQAHFDSTGPEIWKDTAGKVDIFMSGCGTGGTLSGAGKYLKSRNPEIQVMAVEPAESPVLSGGVKGPHGIQGIGPGFIPDVTDTSIIDRVVTVTTEEALDWTRRLASEEGLLVGISSGAAFAGAIKIAKSPENAGKMIVVILPSAGERYLSTPLFAEIRDECEKMEVISA
ncbi:hypothetical protein SELMODRAFT_186442 [Selaginella moellendorffii]|uniref:Cysteine synthase n=1 Tax=Selaginella moellendorffii TaxID=88036 RepID=D8T8M1_SELML|nr:cysteine synthase [Selaginella moellendorffii]EFJ07061.1 hypothetical protein SELMODRAFT_186442 [Selaginella moellendorffii]|eukprot:XP_002991950.1 cysteine synthase [Selaginella moellendorffii]